MIETDCCAVTSEEPWYEFIRSYLLTRSCKEGEEHMITAKSAWFMMVLHKSIWEGILKTIVKVRY